MTAAARPTTATVHSAVYRTDRHASVNLVYHMDELRACFIMVGCVVQW